MKQLLIFLLLGATMITSSAAEISESKNAYDFTFKTLQHQDPMPLLQYKGKVLLIVNTASECGFTSQYRALEKLYSTYKDQGLVVIGVPSNDFGNQEPASNEEIATFCQKNFGVTFPMTSKESVTGKNAHPFYLWAYETLGFGTGPKWNFHKYLINRQGKVVDYFNSTTKPDAKKVITAIQSALD